MNEIAAVILTLNEQKHIRDCIDSVSWADRVVVVDTFSTDATVSLAKESGAEVMQRRFEHYAQIRNTALASVDSPWIFFVDADERATPELAAEIRLVTTTRPEVGWWVPRLNYLFGRLTRGAGWFPDHQMRLLRRGLARYERPVHEIVILDGPEGFLKNPLVHYTYETVAQFRAKQSRYTMLDAQTLLDQGAHAHFLSPVSQFARHFAWRLITLQGYRDGLHGLRLSLLTSWYQAATYHRLWRLQNTQG